MSGLGSYNFTNWCENIYTRNLVCTNEIPFNNYYAPVTNSEPHVFLTYQNVDWIFNELAGTPQAAPADYNSIYPIQLLSGSEPVCPSATYKVNNLPAGSSIIWSINPSNLATVSSSGLVTRQGSSNGIASLIAKVTSSCTGTFTVSKSITVGTVQPGAITFPLIDGSLGKLQAQIDPVVGANSYNWYKNGVLQTGHSTFIQMSITRNQCNVYYDIAVAALSACGTSAQTHKQAYVPPCGNNFQVSPNPATSSIDVTQFSSDAKIEEVRLYDLKGTIRKAQKFNKTSTAKINLQSIANGTYVLEIISGGISEKHQLIVQH